MDAQALKKSEAATALKQLREARKDSIAAAAARLKEQNRTIKAIKAELQQPKTIPELARATGMTTRSALWYVAALKKYGEVKEAEKDGPYYRYVTTSGEQP